MRAFSHGWNCLTAGTGRPTTRSATARSVARLGIPNNRRSVSRDRQGCPWSNSRSGGLRPVVTYKLQRLAAFEALSRFEDDLKQMKGTPSISHDEAMSRELRENPEFAAEYLTAAMENEADPRVLLIALRRVAEARGLAKVAKTAGIERESLYRC